MNSTNIQGWNDTNSPQSLLKNGKKGDTPNSLMSPALPWYQKQLGTYKKKKL